jgi:multidrug efflux system membrane fusion protein
MKVRLLLLVFAAVLICGAVYQSNLIDGQFWARLKQGRSQASPQATPTVEAARPNNNLRPAALSDANPVPVVVAPVRKNDVPIYLSGLGTVQAFYMVAVKSQVDGVIVRVNFREGQDVKTGDPLVIIDPQTYQAKLEEVQGLRDRAIAQLENAKLNLSRNEELLKKDFATQKATDRTKMEVAQYTAEIVQHEGQIKYAQALLDYSTIRSPINGRIGIRKVDPGNLIRAADNLTIATVVQLQPISVIITLPAKALQRNNVSLGLTNLPVIAYAENGITTLGRGEVQMVDNTVDKTTGTIQVKALFSNDQVKFWPGDFVDCKIIIEQRRDGLTVPTAAIRRGARGDFVWVIQPDNQATIRPVKLRQNLGGTAVIEDGLEAGERVVIDGYVRLTPGTRVKIASADSDDEAALPGDE